MIKVELQNTKKGLEAISRAINGEVITFTKLEYGNGVATSGVVKDMAKIINTLGSTKIAVVTTNEETLRVRGNISNDGVKDDIFVREYGIYAKIENGKEFLFAYLNDADATITIPSSSKGRWEANRDFVLYIGEVGDYDFTGNGNLVYTTIADLRNYMHYNYRCLVGERYKEECDYREYLLGDVYFKEEIISIGAEVPDSSSPILKNIIDKKVERKLKTLNGDVESNFHINMPHSEPVAGVQLESGVRIASENYTVGFSIHKDIRIVTVEIQNSTDPSLISSMIEDINPSPKLTEVESLYTPIHKTTEANPSGFAY